MYIVTKYKDTHIITNKLLTQAKISQHHMATRIKKNILKFNVTIDNSQLGRKLQSFYASKHVKGHQTVVVQQYLKIQVKPPHSPAFGSLKWYFHVKQKQLVTLVTTQQ